MKDVPCKYSAAVREALKSGSWEPELRRHVSACPSCRQEARVRDWLLQLARQPQHEAPPALSYLIWLKAQLAEKQEAQKRALRPFVYVQMAAEIVLGLAFIFVIAWNRTAIEQWLKSSTLESLVSSIGAFDGGVSFAFLLFFAASLLGMGLLFTFKAFAGER